MADDSDQGVCIDFYVKLDQSTITFLEMLGQVFDKWVEHGFLSCMFILRLDLLVLNNY